MSLRYFIRPQAELDLDGIIDDLAERGGVDLALLFLREFEDACALLSSQPEMGWRTQIRYPRLRSARTLRVSARFDQYLIFCLLPGERIEIIRVLHGAQDLDALLERGSGAE